jgi:transposase
VFYQTLRSREKVSSVAALTLSPQRRRVGLYFSLRPNANLTTRWLRAFLRDLLRHLRNPVVLVWDRLPVHRARALAEFFHRHPRLHPVLLPPYAPELNPVELLWAYLKQNPLANLAAPDAHRLARLARYHTRRLQASGPLLRGFLRGTPLSFDLN